MDNGDILTIDCLRIWPPTKIDGMLFLPMLYCLIPLINRTDKEKEYLAEMNSVATSSLYRPSIVVWYIGLLVPITIAT